MTWRDVLGTDGKPMILMGDFRIISQAEYEAIEAAKTPEKRALETRIRAGFAHQANLMRQESLRQP